MAGEAQARDATALSTVYVFLRNDATGEIWNTDTGAFESLTAGNIADYEVALGLIADTEEWIGDMPSGVPASRCYFEFRRRLTADAPAWDDVHKGYSVPFEWDGSAIVMLASVSADIVTIKADTSAIRTDTNELQTDWADGGRLDVLLDSIKVKTDNLPGSIPKGVALSDFPFVLVSSVDHRTPTAGLTATAYILKDAGSFVAAGVVTEVAYGVYKISLTAAEMNADKITLMITATGADVRIITILTDT